MLSSRKGVSRKRQQQEAIKQEVITQIGWQLERDLITISWRSHRDLIAI